MKKAALASAWMLCAGFAPPAGAAFAPKNRPYRVQRYALDVRLDAQTGRFDNSVRIRLLAAGPLREVELDSEGLSIRSAEDVYSKRPLGFEVRPGSGTLAVSLDRELKAGEVVELEIRYSGAAGTEQQGLFRVSDPRDPGRLPLYFTQFEPTAARRFFPCDDEPTDKALLEVSAETDPRYQILSNGRLVEDRVVKVEGARKRRTRWEMDKPQSTYLAAFAAGQFETLKSEAAGVPLRVFTAPGRAQEARYALKALEKALPFYDSFFGMRYPWSSCRMAAVPGFMWGGMENTTLTFMLESAMALEDPSAELGKIWIAETVEHELAHQWFGDWVTMKWWDDVWLNESFATYMQALAARDFFGTDWPVIEMVTDAWEGYFREEDGPRSHPIVTRELPTPDDAFDSTNYVKGANVLRMLEFYVGTGNFRAGIKDYLSRFGLGNADHEDFFAAMERASGQDLSRFKEGWLRQRGYPVLDVSESWSGKRSMLTLQARQTPNHPGESAVWDFKLPVSLHRRTEPAYDLNLVLGMDVPQAQTQVPLPAAPEWVSWNPGGAALAKIRRNGASEESRALQALYDPDPISRIAALFELAGPWISREEKTLKALSPLAVRTIRQSLASDPSPYVRAALMGKLLNSKWPRLPQDFSDELLALEREPAGLPENDPLGRLLVRARALALLGKTGCSQGRTALKEILSDPSAGIDLVSAAASGTARFGDEAAIEALKAALAFQGRRGFPLRKAIRGAFGRVENVAVIRELSAILADPETNDEIVGSILRGLGNNETIKNSPEGAAWIKDAVLGKTLDASMRARVLGVLAEAKAPAVRPVLEEIERGADSPRLKAIARQFLDKNFPGSN